MFYNFRYSIHAIVRIDHINGYKSLYFDADIKKCPTEEIKINLKMLGRYLQTNGLRGSKFPTFLSERFKCLEVSLSFYFNVFYTMQCCCAAMYRY